MEQLIARSPAQYLWSYNRYKVPRGAPPPTPATPDAAKDGMRLLIAFMWLLHWLPLPILGRFGVAVGSLLFIAMPTRRKIALTNLRLCMPELTEQQRVALARQHFQAYSRSVGAASCGGRRKNA
jgi:lauroyl/myristoyl acyltransferase